MIWVLVVFIVLALIVLIVSIQAKRAEIETVVPGSRFLDKRKNGNPFLEDNDYRYVVEVSNGWVKYKCGQNGSAIHSMQLGEFVDWLEIVEST